MRTHVLYEGVPGVLVETADVTIEGVELIDLVDRAVTAASSANRIELCGGLDVADAARVIEAVGDAAEVRINRYGFESLEQVAEYKRAFAHGDAAPAAFLYRSRVTTALDEHPGTLVAGVADAIDLAAMARDARERGAGIIELYAGLGAVGAATVRRATGDAIPVGFVDA